MPPILMRCSFADNASMRRPTRPIQRVHLELLSSTFGPNSDADFVMSMLHFDDSELGDCPLLRQSIYDFSTSYIRWKWHPSCAVGAVVPLSKGVCADG